MKRIVYFGICILITISGFSQKKDSIVWLPDATLYPSAFMDQRTMMNFLSFPKKLSPDDAIFNYPTYIPFGYGFEYGIARKKNHQLDIYSGTRVLFGFRKENNKYMKGTRRSFINIDYYLGISWSAQWAPSLYGRASLFHRSSHLGDDFVMLNTVATNNYWKEDPTNYEMFRYLLSIQKEKYQVYGGIGMVIRPETPRKRQEYYAGFELHKLSQSKGIKNLFIGSDIEIIENNDYHPNIKSGIGYLLTPQKNTALVLEYYTGHLPYSRYEKEIKISWFALSLYIQPF